MKQFKYFLFAVMMLFVGINVLSQDPEPPETVFDAIGDFGLYLATLGGLAVLSTFVTATINGLFQVLQTNVRLAISWAVPILLAFLGGALLNIGFLTDEPWYLITLYGFGAGLISNRGYDAVVIQQMVHFIESLLGNKTIRQPR